MTRLAAWLLVASLVPADVRAQVAPVLVGPAGEYASKLTLVQPGPLLLQAGRMVGPAGVYTIDTTGLGDVLLTRAGNQITIAWGSGPPTPTPPTPPGPPSIPVIPLATQLHVMLVYDATQQTPAPQLALKTSTTLPAALADPSIHAIVSRVDVTTKTAQDWIPEAKIAGIPAMLVIPINLKNETVAPFRALPLPSGPDAGLVEAAVIAEVKKSRGVN